VGKAKRTYLIRMSLHQNFLHCDVDLLIVSFNSAPKWNYPLNVGELVVDV